MEKDQKSDNTFSDRAALRKRAEQALSSNPEGHDDPDCMSPETIKKLVHDLSVHQIELEMQNDELRCTQAELETTRDKYTDLYDFSPVGYATINEKGIITETNLTLTQMLGVDRNQVVGKPFSNFVYDNDQDSFLQYRRRLSETESGRSLELRLLKKEGNWFCATIESMVTKTGDSSENQIRMAVTDSSERIQSEKTIKASRQAWEDTFNAISDWVSLIDVKTGQILETNAAGETLLGKSRKEIIGQACWSLLHGTNEPIQDGSIRRMIDSGKRELSEIYLASLKKWLSVTADPIRDGNNNITRAVHIVRDITDRNRAEEEKKKLETQLQQAQKMDSIGNLAGGVAHDFNNILSAIFGFTELAIDGMDKDSKNYDHLKEVMSAGNRAKELVQQILSFSRQTEHEMKPFDISRLVNEVRKMLRSTIPSSIAIDVDNQAENTTISGDFTQLHQVLLNLCTNASHAMEGEGGTLEIGLRNISFDEEDKKLVPGEYLQLAVSDTGIGIAPEIIDQVFEPYFTTKEIAKGTGMGLAVVHGIIKSHTGNITVYSEPGKGTTFNVYLPVVKEAGRDVSVQPKKIIVTGDERILFVDDEPSIVKLQQQSLDRLGYSVVAKTSSLEALETFKAAPGAFDLVITDMTMPNMTGDRLAKEIKKIRPDLPVILCTGFSGKIKLAPQDSEKFQIDKLLMKPVDKAEMSRTIREVLDKAKGGVQ